MSLVSILTFFLGYTIHKMIKELHAEISRRMQSEQKLYQERDKLKDAIDNVKLLSGLLPICAECKKIRDDKGYWTQIENYIRDHSEANFTHSVCPDCAKRLYPYIDF